MPSSLPLTARQAPPTTQYHLSSSHCRLNRARKSRFCRKTHIFSKNAGQPQDGVNPLLGVPIAPFCDSGPSSSGTTTAPHATSPSSSPQISDQTFKASCTTLLVTLRKYVVGSPSRDFAPATSGSTGDNRTVVIGCDSSPSDRTDLVPWLMSGEHAKIMPAAGVLRLNRKCCPGKGLCFIRLL